MYAQQYSQLRRWNSKGRSEKWLMRDAHNVTFGNKRNRLFAVFVWIIFLSEAIEILFPYSTIHAGWLRYTLLSLSPNVYTACKVVNNRSL